MYNTYTAEYVAKVRIIEMEEIPVAIHMFQQLIDTLKKSPKKIVFTEGTDPRIL